jgi:hypothetical protein
VSKVGDDIKERTYKSVLLRRRRTSSPRADRAGALAIAGVPGFSCVNLG